MRYRSLRYDIWICLLLAYLISLVPVGIIKHGLKDNYEDYREEHTVNDGDIGGKASDDVFRAESVEDLLSHDTFTVISPGIQYMNKGAGYYGKYYMHALTLPSGEKVAAIYNTDSVQKMGDSIYSGDSILPVGKVVFEDLTQNESFINQIEYKEKLSRTDFYVDMMGNGGKVSEEDFEEMKVLPAQIITIVVAFLLIHALGSKLGIFPYFFAPKKKQESEWK